MIEISFVTHLPLLQGSPTIKNISNKELFIVLSDKDNRIGNISVILKPNEIYSSPYQYFINWNIKVWENFINDDNQLKNMVLNYDIDLNDKMVFIKIDANALGDNIAWFPYIEQFRIKHNCKIICSTFFNELFIKKYPEIMFVKPNTRIENIYAQYYIGTYDNLPSIYSPINYLDNPLQKVASDILGLEYKELPTMINNPFPNKKKSKKICLSEFSSSKLKNWDGDWQFIVDELIKRGFEIHVISKEHTSLKNIIDKTGDYPIMDRVKDLNESQYFIGNSSGLSWLAHNLGCHVFLISDFTPVYHEFSTNTTRINSSNSRKKIIYEPLEHHMDKYFVLNKILDSL